MNDLAFAVVATLLAAPAGAATFDFTQLARNTTATHGQEVSFATAFPGGFTLDGITVHATTIAPPVWLDSHSAGSSPAAGLGVCEVGDCNGHHLDGIDSDDTLTLSFNQPVRLTDLLVRESNAAFYDSTSLDHTPFTGIFQIDGQSFSVVDGITQGLDLQGNTFSFLADALFAAAGGEVSQYVSAVTVAAVPLPAAGFLLLAAVSAVAGLRRLAQVRTMVAGWSNSRPARSESAA